MEWQKSVTGNDVVIVDKYTYMSFGSDGTIKWIHLSYMDESGVRRGQLLPITLNKVKGEYTKKIGKKNLTTLRTLVQPKLEGDILSRKNFIEIGETINREQKGK